MTHGRAVTTGQAREAGSGQSVAITGHHVGVALVLGTTGCMALVLAVLGGAVLLAVVYLTACAIGI